MPLDSVLNQLDYYLDNSQQFIDNKERIIKQWRTEYNCSTSGERRYEASIRLFDEYKSYKYDSAYTYAYRSLQLAERLDNKGYIAEAKNAIVFCLFSSGLFKEAFDIIKQIDTKDIPLATLIEYYSLYSRLYYDIADYNHETPFQSEYVRQGGIYTDSLLALLPESSMKWWYATGQRQMKERQYDACIHSFCTILQREDLDPHTEAIIASCLGWTYRLQGDQEKGAIYLCRAAIGDIRSATKETTALCVLAELLYDRDEVDRANRYIQLALADANFYNARHRKLSVGTILPIIQQERFDIVKKQRNTFIVSSILFSVLFLFLVAAVLIIYKQVKKLAHSRRYIEERNNELLATNKKLSEATRIKDEYIGYSFYQNSEYLEKMENLYKTINRKIAARQFDELRNIFKVSSLNQERDNMYAAFDRTFLNLFPGFIAAYNALFPEKEQVKPDSDSTLTSEMRIFALIRLGINESERIAKFLNYSVHTINTYKTRVKNKSLVPNELFESRIMEIESGRS